MNKQEIDAMLDARRSYEKARGASMKGYKAFDKNLSCREFQFEVGQTYRHDGDIELCRSGFHFCEKLADCYSHYPDGSRVCEVEATGKVVTGPDGKSVTDEIAIVRELTANEILSERNSGWECTGIGNSGDRNSGDWNTGYRNSGDWNSGNRNTGNWNSGDWNSGDWNMTNFSSGVLCTVEPECLIFDLPSGMTLKEWRQTEASDIMDRIKFDATQWVSESCMTDAEKKEHPEFFCCGGYLKRVNSGYRFAEWWQSLTDREKDVIKAIPNFDADKWKKITGIEVAS